MLSESARSVTGSFSTIATAAVDVDVVVVCFRPRTLNMYVFCVCVNGLVCFFLISKVKRNWKKKLENF